MPGYKCVCGMTFSTEYNLKRHCEGKNCTKNSNSKTNKKTLFKCKNPGCKVECGRKDNLTRHMKKCKYKNKNVVNAKNFEINGNSNNTNNIGKGDVVGNDKIVNSGDFRTYNITINSFGKDGSESIDFDVLKVLTQTPKSNTFSKLVKSVNFDPNKPQHHNVYLDDLKSGVGHVFEKDQWNVKRIPEILDELIDSKVSDVIKFVEEQRDVIKKKLRTQLLSAVDEVRETPIGHDGKSYPPGARSGIKKHIRTSLYNNRDTVIETRKKTEKNKSRKVPKRKIVESESEDSECEEI